MASQWYIARGGQQYGPYTSDNMKEMVQSGNLQREDQVWKEGMPEWVDAGRIKGMFPQAAAAPPPPQAAAPPPPQSHAPQTAQVAAAQHSSRGGSHRSRRLARRETPPPMDTVGITMAATAVLLTIVIPWVAGRGVVAMSWDIVSHMEPLGAMGFIGGWLAAAGAMIITFTCKPKPRAIGVGCCAMVGLLSIFLIVAAGMENTRSMRGASPVLVIVALLAIVGNITYGHLRMRFPESMSVRFTRLVIAVILIGIMIAAAAADDDLLALPILFGIPVLLIVMQDAGVAANSRTFAGTGLGFIYGVTLFLFIGGMISAMNRGRGEAFTLYMNIGLYFGGLMMLLSWGLAQMFDRLGLRESNSVAE